MSPTIQTSGVEKVSNELQELIREVTQGGNSIFMQTPPSPLGGSPLDPLYTDQASGWTPSAAHLAVHYREELASFMRQGWDSWVTRSSCLDTAHPSGLDREERLSPDFIVRQGTSFLQELPPAHENDSPPASAMGLCREMIDGGCELNSESSLRLIQAARQLTDTDKMRVCHAKALMDYGEDAQGERLALTCTGLGTAPLVRASAWSFIAQSKLKSVATPTTGHTPVDGTQRLGSPQYRAGQGESVNAWIDARDAYVRASQLDPSTTIYSLAGFLSSLVIGDANAALQEAECLEAHSSWGDAEMFAQAGHFSARYTRAHPARANEFQSTLTKIESQLGPIAWYIAHEVSQSN